MHNWHWSKKMRFFCWRQSVCHSVKRFNLRFSLTAIIVRWLSKVSRKHTTCLLEFVFCGDKMLTEKREIKSTQTQSDTIGKSDHWAITRQCVSICRLEPLNNRQNSNDTTNCADALERHTDRAERAMEMWKIKISHEGETTRWRGYFICCCLFLYTENASHPLHVQPKPYVQNTTRCEYVKSPWLKVTEQRLSSSSSSLSLWMG